MLVIPYHITWWICHEEDDEKVNFVPFSSMEKLFFKVEKWTVEKQKTTKKMKKKMKK
jgi:hypothetical protein